MKYSFIELHRSSSRVVKMCHALKVSRSGYYRWRLGHESKRSQQNRVLLSRIRIVHQRSRRKYGSPRVTDDLRESGFSCSQNRVAKLMREHNIRAKRGRKYKVTTKSKHNHPVAPNLLNRQFEVSTANAVWVSDITYIWTSEGWLYLAGVVDLYSRMVVGWSLSNRINEELTLAALKHALARRRPSKGLLHHSDQGSQYAAGGYQKLLKDHGMICSMSRKGDCWDNAVMESFFATLKSELIYQESFATKDEARLKIFDYIEVYYNRKRRHSSLGSKSPAEFELTAKPT